MVSVNITSTVKIIALIKAKRHRVVLSLPAVLITERMAVEIFERLMCGEICGLQPSQGRLALPLDKFQFGQLQQERQVIDVILGAAGGHLFAFGQYGRQL